MAKRNSKLGKVVKSHLGHNIRIELKEVKLTELDRFGREKVTGYKKSDAGTFAVYAGKKIKSGGHKTIEAAILSI